MKIIDKLIFNLFSRRHWEIFDSIDQSAIYIQGLVNTYIDSRNNFLNPPELLIIHYDKTADVLYIKTANPIEELTDCENSGDCDLIFRDANGYITGFTIIGIKERYIDTDKPKSDANFNIFYSDITGILQIVVKDTPAFSKTFDGLDIVRYDPETNEIVGIQIIDFKQRFIDN